MGLKYEPASEPLHISNTPAMSAPLPKLHLSGGVGEVLCTLHVLKEKDLLKGRGGPQGVQCNCRSNVGSNSDQFKSNGIQINFNPI